MEETMEKMKTLSCMDAWINCDFVARWETTEDVLSSAMEHVKKDHPDKMIDVSETEMRQMLIWLVKDERNT